jgi:polysaccharide pyruvyl transferase WcaK-like protein
MGSRHVRASFTGYYGMRNFGDDLFGFVCSSAARSFWHCDARLVGPTIPGVRARYTMPRWYSPRLYGSATPVGQASRVFSLASAIASSNLLVLGGGSLVHSRTSALHKCMMAAHRAGRVELAAVGISIGPFDDSAAARAASEFLRHFRYIAVRDRRSYEVALTLGVGDRVHNGRDLVGLLPILRTDITQRSRARGPHERSLGVALCNYIARRDYDAPSMRDLLADLTRAIAALSRQHQLRVALFSRSDHPLHGDFAITKEFQARLRDEGVAAGVHRYGDQGPLEVAREISQCDALISARLHGAITAYILGVPFAMIDYHPKCRDFAEDVGIPDVQRIHAANQGSEAIRAALLSLVERTDGPRVAPEAYARQAADIFLCSPWSTRS